MRVLSHSAIVLLLNSGYTVQSISVQDPSRRHVVVSVASALLSTSAPPASASTAFRTQAVGRSEYTNSITASRDTNISPQEAYDIIQEFVPKSKENMVALDLGAGAGLSTSLLYDKGYTTIDAVDWSKDAWEANVIECPETVKFYEAADSIFFQSHRSRYDVIVYNFAVNPNKVKKIARDHLLETGILLAPVNDKADYWYKQSYWLVNAKGEIVYQSRPEVGAWSVQFQPDVTSDTCTGIWCGGFNGFSSK